MTDAQTEIGTALGQIPSGVFILTARNADGQETGMLASWVQQSAFDPPAVTVAVNKSRYLNEWLDENAVAAINVVGHGQTVLLKHFGRGFEPGEDAFAGLETESGQTGVRLLTDCLSNLEGCIRGHVDSGDHVVYVLEIQHARVTRPDEKPMVHLRRNGFGY